MKKLTRIAGLLAIVGMIISLSSSPSMAGVGWGTPRPNAASASLNDAERYSYPDLSSSNWTWQTLLIRAIRVLGGV